jgi:hypothetical protein
MVDKAHVHLIGNMICHLAPRAIRVNLQRSVNVTNAACQRDDGLLSYVH